MVRAHRQAWCWQDEWYGLSMENIRELEKEAQLMLSRKMAQFKEHEEEAKELSQGEAGQELTPGEPPQPSSTGEPLAGRGLKKQWSTSSKSSRSSKRGGEIPALGWSPAPVTALSRPCPLRGSPGHCQRMPALGMDSCFQTLWATAAPS